MGLLIMLLYQFSWAQTTTISGNVIDEAGPLIGANIIVVGKVIGTVTDANGDFRLRVSSPPPFKISISMVGYTAQELEVTESADDIKVELIEGQLLGEEVVVSASRLAESILESPISVERIDVLDIQNAPSADFYSGLKNLNGIDVITQSLTFNSVNARGFGSNGNARFVQLIDGIDNQAPGLNFPIGNVVGISELDLESMEVMPGAASALYGPNAIQGIILMKSKSPFDYQGLDFYSKVGVNHIDEEDHDMSIYHDYGLRYAKAFNNKIAFKITGSYLEAQDFVGVDERDMSQWLQGGTIEGNLNSDRSNRVYDGVNIYGEPSINAIAASGQTDFAPLFPGTDANFTPTGFKESELLDNTVRSIKMASAIHYRINDDLEWLGQFNYGSGSSVYTANDRFVLDDFSIWTAKTELKGSDFFLRGYITQEDAGDSYAANTLAGLINANQYAPDYIGALLSSRGQGLSVDQSHQQARLFADRRQQSYLPGTTKFDSLSDHFRNLSIADGGAKFIDKTAMYHAEGSYSLQRFVDWADIVLGGSIRHYALNSEGTVFALDDDGNEFSINEWGAYLQMKRKFFDRLSLQGSMRYDKNEYYKGQFSPRFSAVWEFLNNQNFRAAYQRGFRIPTTQDQFIDLDVVTRRLIGANQFLKDRYNINNNTIYEFESVIEARAAAARGEDPLPFLKRADDAYSDFTTEKVGTWEIGYKGSLLDGKLFIDAFYYQSVYSDLTGDLEVVQATKFDSVPLLQEIPDGFAGPHGPDQQRTIVNNDRPTEVHVQNFSYSINVPVDVDTRGFGLAADYSLGKSYNIGFNTSYNEMVSLDDATARVYNISFNTPKWRYNVKFGNRKLTDKLGYSLSYRWQDAYLWQSSIGSGVIPAFGTLDAQITYHIPSINARLKLGGSNILNERYTASLANPRLGAIYYVQLNFSDLLK